MRYLLGGVAVLYRERCRKTRQPWVERLFELRLINRGEEGFDRMEAIWSHFDLETLQSGATSNLEPL
jgi:hypothetical protein